ncbi:MAG: hypothetical protein ABSH20_09850 [Tepidisphaeraceae bacterium]|jgi:hypothetical protein
MRHFIQMAAMAAMAALLLLASGCFCGSEDRPRTGVAITVRDAESGTAVDGAHVTYVYTMYGVPCYPLPASRSTGTDSAGNASLRVSLAGDNYWRVEAHGYLDYRSDHGLQRADESPAVFALFREPRPQVTIRVPAGFKGPLKVTTQPVEEGLVASPGRRVFQAVAEATGRVTIEAPAILMWWRVTQTGPERVSHHLAAKQWFTVLDDAGCQLPPLTIYDIKDENQIGVFGPLTDNFHSADAWHVRDTMTELYFVGNARHFDAANPGTGLFRRHERQEVNPDQK